MSLSRTLRFIFGFLILIVLGLYSLNYSQGRIGYSGPVADTSMKVVSGGASVGDAWDRITSSFTPLPKQAEKIAPSNSITDSVTRDLIDLYLQARTAGGGTVSASTTEALAGSVVKYGKGYIDVNRYTTADVLLETQDTPETQKKYLNALATIIDVNFRRFPKENFATSTREVVIFQEALRTNEFRKLKELEPYRAAYAAAVVAMRELRVPASYMNNHLDMLNSFATSEEAMQRVMNFESDPLGAIYGMRAYIQEYARGARVTTSLASFMANGGFIFSDGEPAYALARYLRVITP